MMKIHLLKIFIFVCLLSKSVFATSIDLPFYVPGNATNTMSRTFYTIAKQFMKENPNINIKFRSLENWDDILTEVIKLTQAKKSAGVIVAELAELYTLKDANAIMPLGQVIKDKKKFFRPFEKQFLKSCFDDSGKLYAIPYIRSTAIAYYNLDILAKANITKNNLPKTWKELKKALEKIKKVTGKPPFAFAPTWYDWLFEAFVKQNGGVLIDTKNKKILFDTPEVIEALEYLSDLKKNGLLYRPWGKWKTAIHRFASGSIPVLYYSSGGLKTVFNRSKINWTTSVLPKNKVNGSVYGAGNIFLSKNMSSAQIESALKFVNYLLRPRNQALITLNSGFFPVIKSALDEVILSEFIKKEQFINAKKQLDYALHRTVIRHNREMRVIVQKAIDRTLDDGQSAKASLQQSQKKAQQYIK